MLGLVIFFVVVSSIVLIGKLDHSATIGASQLELLKRYQDFEGMRVYTENTVRLSAYKTLQDMDISSCSNINVQEFNNKLSSGVREYLSVDLSQPAFKVKAPHGYDFQSSITPGGINIIGIGDDIEISSPISETLTKLSHFAPKSDQECVKEGNACKDYNGYNLLILKAPKYLVSGGANINIDIRCDDYAKYVAALNYEPTGEVSA